MKKILISKDFVIYMKFLNLNSNKSNFENVYFENSKCVKL